MKSFSDLRKATKPKSSLRVRIEKGSEEAETPEAESIDAEDEETYQASVLIGSVVRGRAVQVMVSLAQARTGSFPGPRLEIEKGPLRGNRILGCVEQYSRVAICSELILARLVHCFEV